MKLNSFILGALSIFAVANPCSGRGLGSPPTDSIDSQQEQAKTQSTVSNHVVPEEDERTLLEEAHDLAEMHEDDRKLLEMDEEEHRQLEEKHGRELTLFRRYYSRYYYYSGYQCTAFGNFGCGFYGNYRFSYRTWYNSGSGCCFGSFCGNNGACVSTNTPSPPTPAPTPKQCTPRNGSCRGDNFCCGGLTCQVIGGTTNPTSICVGGNEVPGGPAPTPTTNRNVCVDFGGFCSNGESCCDSFTCQLTAGGSRCLRSNNGGGGGGGPTAPTPTAPTVPSPGVCRRRTESCANGARCCNNLVCTNTSTGPECRFNPPICEAENQSCANGQTCCGDLTCQSTINGPTCLFPSAPVPVPVPVPVPGPFCQTQARPCGGNAFCCAGLTCQATRFGGNRCRPFRPLPPAPVPVPRSCSLFNQECGLGQPCCGGFRCTAVAAGLRCRR